MGVFDAYSLRARTAPAALAVLPALVLLLGGALSRSTAGSAGALVAAALGLVASHLARDAGRRLEPSLWESWGGSPTLRRLRHRGASETEVVSRLHTRIEAVLEGRLPSREQEAADPTGADQRYERAIADLRERTRDRLRFPLVFAENVSYGFRRNLLGLRPWGLAIALIGLAVSGLLIGVDAGTLGERLRAWSLPAALTLAAAAFWWRVVTPDWVRLAAENYVDRLLGALEILRAEPVPTDQRTPTP